MLLGTSVLVALSAAGWLATPAAPGLGVRSHLRRRRHAPSNLCDRLTVRDLRERLGRLGVDSSDVFERAELERLLDEQLELCTDSSRPSTTSSAVSDSSNLPPVHTMHIQELMSELELLGVQFNVLDSQAALARKLQVARSARGRTRPRDTHVPHAASWAAARQPVKTPRKTPLTEVHGPQTTFQAKRSTPSPVDRAASVQQEPTPSSFDSNKSTTRTSQRQRSTNGDRDVPHTRQQRLDGTGNGSFLANGELSKMDDGRANLVDTRLGDSRGGVDEVSAVEVDLAEGLEILRNAASSALSIAAPTARAAVAAATSAVADPKNVTTRYSPRRFLSRLGRSSLPRLTTRTKIMALVSCICALRFGLTRTILGVASVILVLDLGQVARGRLTAEKRASANFGRASECQRDGADRIDTTAEPP